MKKNKKVIFGLAVLILVVIFLILYFLRQAQTEVYRSPNGLSFTHYKLWGVEEVDNGIKLEPKTKENESRHALDGKLAEISLDVERQKLMFNTQSDNILQKKAETLKKVMADFEKEDIAIEELTVSKKLNLNARKVAISKMKNFRDKEDLLVDLTIVYVEMPSPSDDILVVSSNCDSEVSQKCDKEMELILSTLDIKEDAPILDENKQVNEDSGQDDGDANDNGAVSEKLNTEEYAEESDLNEVSEQVNEDEASPKAQEAESEFSGAVNFSHKAAKDAKCTFNTSVGEIFTGLAGVVEFEEQTEVYVMGTQKKMRIEQRTLAGDKIIMIYNPDWTYIWTENSVDPLMDNMAFKVRSEVLDDPFLLGQESDNSNENVFNQYCRLDEALVNEDLFIVSQDIEFVDITQDFTKNN
ncbi:MAG: hypothetical protein GF347_04515 [Candidatus Moranbacteria bacterium]|nr:hypothetical protein [Candidatus Moranbacteria bacterium]